MIVTFYFEVRKLCESPSQKANRVKNRENILCWTPRVATYGALVYYPGLVTYSWRNLECRQLRIFDCKNMQFCLIVSLIQTKLLMQNFAFPFKFLLVLVDLGSQRKNMTLKKFDFVRGRRYRRFKNDDFQIDPSISRDRVIFRIGT